MAEEPPVPPEVLERLRLFIERGEELRQAVRASHTMPPRDCGLLRQPDPNAPPPRVIYRTTLGEIIARSGQEKREGNVLPWPWGKVPPND